MTVTRISTTLKAATNVNLTTADTFKTAIGKAQSDKDDYLTTWVIPTASSEAEQYCNRLFRQESICDQFRIARSRFVRGDDEPLALSRTPVVNLWAVTDESCVATTLSGAMDAVQTTMPVAAALSGTLPLTVVIDPGTSSAEVVTVTSLSGGTTYNVTRGVNGNPKAHASAGAVITALDADLVKLDADDGQIYRLNADGVWGTWNRGDVFAYFTGGYLLPGDTSRTLPMDVENAVIQIMRYKYWNDQRDPTLRSESDGSISRTYWVGPPSEKSNMPMSAAAILDNYRTPVLS